MSDFLTPSESGPSDRAQKFQCKDWRTSEPITVTRSAGPCGGSSSKVEWIVRTVETWARLSHPAIISVLDLRVHGGVVDIFTENHSGPTLKEFLEGPPERRRLPADDLKSLVEDLASGLHYAHAYGVVHGDLCPEQILLCRDRRARLLRFAPEVLDLRIVGEWEELPTLGFYQSPQQVIGRRATPADDIYAMGVLLYRLISGSYPFTGSTVPFLCDQILNDQPPPVAVPSEFPTSAAAVVHRCLQKNPEERFGSIPELLDALYPGTLLPTVDVERILELDQIGLQCLDQGRHEDSLAAWQQAESLDRYNGRLSNNVGVSLSRLGRLAEAEERFRAALEVLPREGDVRLNLGWVLWKQGRTQDARLQLEQMVQLDRADAEAYLMLGLMSEGYESTDFLSQAMMLRPWSPEICRALAEACRFIGQFERAEKLTGRAEELDPDGEAFSPRHVALNPEQRSPGSEGWPPDYDGGVTSPRKPVPRSPVASEAKDWPSSESDLAG